MQCTRKSLKVFRLKAAILGLQFVKSMMLNCIYFDKSILNNGAHPNNAHPNGAHPNSAHSNGAHPNGAHSNSANPQMEHLVAPKCPFKK